VTPIFRLKTGCPDRKKLVKLRTGEKIAKISSPTYESRIKWEIPMNMARHPVLVLSLLAALVISPSPSDVARAGTGGKSPPAEIYSPGKKYSVTLTHNAGPGSDYNRGSFTLKLLANGKAISQFPTEGYLLGAYWSPDGKYVAVNNYREKSGDYLWVLSLENGKAIHVPDDSNPKKLVAVINDKFPDYTFDALQHWSTRAAGWAKTDPGYQGDQGDILNIKTYLNFSNLHGTFIQLEERYRVNPGGDWNIIPSIPIIEKVPVTGK
jgi:hypothetical protein